MLKWHSSLIFMPLALVAALEPCLDLDVSQGLDEEPVLVPVPQPDKDLMDLGNIELVKDVSMLWKQEQSGSISVSSQMKYPTVKLEEIGFIDSVKCDSSANSLQVAFKDDKAFKTAQEKWPADGQFLVVTNNMGNCDDETERGFYFAEAVTADEGSRRLDIKGKRTELKETAGEEMDIVIEEMKPQLARRAEFSKTIDVKYDLPQPKEIFNKWNTSLTAESFHIDASLTFSGKIKMSWFKVTECWFDMSGHAALDLALKLQIQAQFEKQVSTSTPPMTFPIVAIPGIIAIGPAVSAGIGVDITAVAAIYARAHAYLAFPDAQWRVDLVNSSKSISRGLEPTYNASVQLGGSASLMVNPFLDLRFMLNVQILAGLANLNGGIKIVPKFANTFTVEAHGGVWSTPGTTQPGPGAVEPTPGKTTSEGKGQGRKSPNGLDYGDGKPKKGRGAANSVRGLVRRASGTYEFSENRESSTKLPDEGKQGTYRPLEEDTVSTEERPQKGKKPNESKELPDQSPEGTNRPINEDDAGTEKKPQKGKNATSKPKKGKKPKESKELPDQGPAGTHRPINEDDVGKDGKGQKGGEREKKEKEKKKKTPEEIKKKKKAKGSGKQATDGSSKCPNGLSLKSDFQLQILAFILTYETSLWTKRWPLYEGCYQLPLIGDGE
ncbi:hypothetical protein CDD83_2547 [Cordyceps sp. RAO-2017]|nr:hypothetical protein CDD83_2547 [Cordyceps sp. RAO-2017]